MANFPGEYQCVCFPGFEGKNCTRYQDPCLKGYCSVHSECTSHDFKENKKLLLPEIDVKNDHLVVRKTGDRIPAYQCKCQTGFTGQHCDFNCGGPLDDITGIITSPNYPDPYSTDVRCHWYFTGDIEKIILTVFSIKIGASDAIIIQNATDIVDLVTEKSSFNGQTFNLNGPHITLSFYSHSNNSDNRFVLWFEKVAGSENANDVLKTWYENELRHDQIELEKKYKESLKRIEQLIGNELDFLQLNNSLTRSEQMKSFKVLYDMKLTILQRSRDSPSFGSMSPLSLLETTEDAISEWVEEQMLKLKRVGKVKVQVLYTEFRDSNLEVKLTILAEPFLDIMLFERLTLMKYLGIRKGIVEIHAENEQEYRVDFF